MKMFILCFLSGNELEDIRVCTEYETAMKFLEKYKKSHQILEYNVTDGITDETPLFSYSYQDEVLVKNTFN
jgi:hypothetical protein